MVAMKTRRLNEMSDDSRIWIFQSTPLLVGNLEANVAESLNEFLVNWAAHGSELFSGFDILHDRFIVIAVDENKAPATGCSIDAMMKVVLDIDRSNQLDLMNRMKVAYRDSSGIKECDVNTFREMLKSGAANGDTLVFNNILDSLGKLKNSWEVPVSQSWHANLMV